MACAWYDQSLKQGGIFVIHMLYTQGFEHNSTIAVLYCDLLSVDFIKTFQGPVSITDKTFFVRSR